jgi:predicted SprT family Zn-dependent metalloprotease
LPIQNDNQTSTNELKSLVSQVKFWHDSIINNKTKGVNSENNVKSFSLGPDDIMPPVIDFDKAYKNFDTVEKKGVSIPLEFDPITGNYLQFVTSIEKNKVTGYIVRTIPDSSYRKKHKNIYDYTNFTGQIIVYNIKGKFINKIKFNEGATQISNSVSLINTEKIKSFDDLQEVTVTGYRKKKRTYLKINQSFSYDMDYGGGGGWVIVGGDETPIEPYIILNNITDPCLKKLIENLQNSNKLTNSIGAILQNVFGKNERLNLTFNQDNNLNNNGVRLNGKSIPPDNGNYEIKLNALSLSKYSQERQTLTIMHEILHSYFWAAYGNLVTPNQHTRMLNEYIEEMASSLEDLYPQLSENHDVTIALCFDNLETSVGLADKQINPTVFENAINDDKYKKIGLYLTNWKSIAEKAIYNNDMSTLGTKSPCTY